MTNGLNIFEKIVLKIKTSITNKNDMEEINDRVTLIAVALYFDGKVTALEMKLVEKILDRIFDSDTSFVSLLIKQKIETYKKEFWTYKKDSEFMLKKVLVDGNWVYAEYMVEIFKADGIAIEESKILRELSNLLESRKILMHELGLN